MKSKNIFTIVLVGVLILTLSSFKTITKDASYLQDSKKINAVYDGFEDYGYNFIYKNSEDEERTITFQVVAEDVSKVYDLKSEALVGKTLEVTYTVSVKIQKDDDGFDEEIETHTITKLEKVN